MSLSNFLSVSGPSALSSKVTQEPGLPGRPGQTGRHGHCHPGGVAQTGDGGGEGEESGWVFMHFKLFSVCVYFLFLFFLLRLLNHTKT